MNDLTISSAERIRVFAAAVRAELSDLPEDDIEDLAGGLVGDLTDQAADSGGEIDLGDPVEYARELRAAAGLPERTDAAVRRPLAERWAAWSQRVVTGIRSSRLGTWTLDLLLALRPVWWILRGLALYVLIAFPLWGSDAREFSVPHVLLAAALMLVSVQWGRGRWLPRNWLRHTRTVASVLAVLALPALFSLVTQPTYVYEDGGAIMPDGLLLDGVQVGNLFAYDEDGDLIEQVQLFTDRGTPLNLYGRQSQDMEYGWDDHGTGFFPVPSRDVQDGPIWNSYPLSIAPLGDDGSAEMSQAQRPSPPFLRAPQRAAPPEPSASPTATPTPVPEPTETPAP